MESQKYFLITLLLFPILTSASASITAVFAFGDSILDAGNNNVLPTICRANHPPYGLNFRGRVPTGRFSDGKLVMDFVISDILGIKQLLPAYLDPALTDSDLLTGATFASACTGLDDLTAVEVGAMSLSRQLTNFQRASERIRRTVGPEEEARIVGDAVFVVGAGTNDMLDNYYMLPMRRMLSLSGYQDLLLRNLESVIRRLHSMGAAKLAVMGLPPVGCIPLQVTAGSLIPGAGHLFKRQCMAQYNSDSQAYNAKLQALLSRLQATLPGSNIVYTDIYTPIMEMITNPTAFGFERALEGCCGSISLEMGPMCSAISLRCPNPSNHLFWDAAHPTQAAYRILARRFQEDVLPRLMF